MKNARNLQAKLAKLRRAADARQSKARYLTFRLDLGKLAENVACVGNPASSSNPHLVFSERRAQAAANASPERDPGVGSGALLEETLGIEA